MTRVGRPNHDIWSEFKQVDENDTRRLMDVVCIHCNVVLSKAQPSRKMLHHVLKGCDKIPPETRSRWESIEQAIKRQNKIQRQQEQAAEALSESQGVEEVNEHQNVKVTQSLVAVPNQDAEDRPSLLASTQRGNRRKRWLDLNEIFDKNKKIKIDDESSFSEDESSSIRASYVRWSKVKRVLDYERYKQIRKPIPDRKLEFLVEYLKQASRAMNGYMDAPKKSIFIALVLVMICNLFDDVKLEVEETVIGNEVHADGHFEFVLTRGKTKICIVEAKKNDFEQGKAQALVGCEVVAEREGLCVVYGVVTDFLRWHLYRCGEKSIALDSSTLSVRSDELDMKSMRDDLQCLGGGLQERYSF